MTSYYSLVRKILKVLKACENGSQEEFVSMSFHEDSLRKCHQWKAEHRVKYPHGI